MLPKKVFALASVEKMLSINVFDRGVTLVILHTVILLVILVRVCKKR